MNILDIISRKREGKILTKEEINYMIDGYTKGDVPDYQMSSFLMAICIKGLYFGEISALTTAMRDSGEVLKYPASLGALVDKHSTGGVSDSTTLIVMAILAECGVNMVKMSGRGLGHTGGTIDKLDFFGVKYNFTYDQICEQVESLGAVIMSSSQSLAPADKKIYALRDVSGTVNSVGLIASSIVSKKLASGADEYVLDIKCGRAGFMPRYADAQKLARLMIRLLRNEGKKVTAIISSMNEPLGRGIGCAYEMQDVIRALGGERGDLLTLSMELSVQALILRGHNGINAEKMVVDIVQNGRAKSRLERILRAQGMKKSLDEYLATPKTKYTMEIFAAKNGKVVAIDALTLGKAVNALGGGRQSMLDAIDMSVGIELAVRIGSVVSEGDTLAVVHYNHKKKYHLVHHLIENSIRVGVFAHKRKLILRTVR